MSSQFQFTIAGLRFRFCHYGFNKYKSSTDSGENRFSLYANKKAPRIMQRGHVRNRRIEN